MKLAKPVYPPLFLPDWPTATLETALRFQLDRVGEESFVADCRQACGARSRCGGVCADCLRKELGRRKEAKTA